jgi:CBS domain-containing protein
VERIQRTIETFLRDQPPPLATMDTTVSDGVSLMRSMGSSCVLIISSQPSTLGQLIGLFTERDLLLRVVATGLPPGDTPLGQVMTTDPETLGPLDSIAFAINRMGAEGFRNVPIVDRQRMPLGVLTVRDVVQHLRDVFAGFELLAPTGEMDSPWTDIGGSG